MVEEWLPASTEYRATIGPPAKRHVMAFRWRADSGPLLDVYWDFAYEISLIIIWTATGLQTVLISVTVIIIQPAVKNIMLSHEDNTCTCQFAHTHSLLADIMVSGCLIPALIITTVTLPINSSPHFASLYVVLKFCILIPLTKNPCSHIIP